MSTVPSASPDPLPAAEPFDSTGSPQDPRRRLPAVDRLLDEPGLAALLPVYGRERLVVQARRELESLRSRVEGGGEPDLARAVAELPARIAAALAA